MATLAEGRDNHELRFAIICSSSSADIVDCTAVADPAGHRAASGKNALLGTIY